MLGLSSPHLLAALMSSPLSLLGVRRMVRVHGRLEFSMGILPSLSNLLRLEMYGRMRLQLGQWQIQCLPVLQFQMLDFQVILWPILLFISKMTPCTCFMRQKIQ
uniref:Uncharacterized protein n=1 Tax=Opuntia streptacantha TaxID=393608 RepID=A0A7C9ANK0_OPUST